MAALHSKDRIRITFYTRRDCCLCDEVKGIVHEVVRGYLVDFSEVDIDQDPDLRARFDQQVPVLFIDGRKAFKYRTTAQELRKRLDHVLSTRGNIDADPSM